MRPRAPLHRNHTQSPHVVGEALESSLDFCAEQTHRVNQALTTTKLRHVAKKMFDVDANGRLLSVRGFLLVRQQMITRLTLANLRDETYRNEIFNVARSRVTGIHKNVPVDKFRIQKVFESGTLFPGSIPRKF